LLGVNEVTPKRRTIAWTSDISEHWLPPAFLAWNRYDVLFGNMVAGAANITPIAP
jgi:uncharacterized membrane protein